MVKFKEIKQFMKVKDKINKYLTSRFPNTSKNKSIDKTNITEMLDSLALHDFIFYLEKEFKIKIFSSDISPDNFKTINSLEKFLKNKIK